MWKLISILSLIISVIFLVISTAGEIISQNIRFFWFIYGLGVFSFWNYFPNILEVKVLEKKPAKNWLLIFPVLLILGCSIISNETNFFKKEIVLIIPLLTFSWLSCLTFFGRTVFSIIFYQIIKNPFGLLFRRKFKNSNHDSFKKYKNEKARRR